MSTEGAVSRLVEVLESEADLYVEMRTVLQQELDSIAKLDVTELESAVRAKETLVVEARLLEEGRQALAKEVAEDLDVDDDEPTLSRLGEALGTRGRSLRGAQARLAARVGAVRALRAINNAFAGESLAQVQATLSLLGRLATVDATYGPGGPAGTPGAEGGRLVRRSA